MTLPVLLLLSVLTVGCASRQPAMPDCPKPPEPVLPELDASLPLDSPINMRRLMERDDCMRIYISGLEACIDCYQKIGGK